VSTESSEAKSEEFVLNILKRYWLIGALVIVAIAVYAALQFRSNEQPKYFTTKVDRGEIRQVVEATGTINAVTTVQVGSQVSGTISHLNADFNSRVKKGQVVAQIDPSLFQGSLLQAKADLANAKANVAASQANYEKAQATALQTRTDYQRTAGLTKEGVMSQQQLDLAKANADTADSAVAAARATITQAMAQVQQKQAAVTVAQTNLDYTTIHAPIDGTVIARSVDVGQTVAASLQAPTLFTIAQDLTKMQVYANTDESDVGMIHTGQVVAFKVDAFPKDSFTGRVSQVRLNATTVQNVVTYSTIIDFENPDLKLFPGMTAYITLPVADAPNVLRVPNGALRYKPDMPADQLRALYAKYGLSSGQRSGSQAAGAQNSATQGSGDTGAAAKQRRSQTDGAQGGGAGAGGGQQRTPRVDVAVVWKLLPDKTLEPVRIRTGITDHTVTEVAQVLNGQLNEGDELITGSIAASPSAARAPGMGGGQRPR
jgi:HlyD family secretion protein